jgi:hypothetical protein
VSSNKASGDRKFEARNPKSEKNPKDTMSETPQKNCRSRLTLFGPLSFWTFELICFEFRASDFGFDPGLSGLGVKRQMDAMDIG